VVLSDPIACYSRVRAHVQDSTEYVIEVAVRRLHGEWHVHIPGKDVTNANVELGMHFRSDLGLAQGSRSADHVGYQEVIENAHACENTSWGKLVLV